MTPRVKVGTGLICIILTALLASCYLPEKFTATLHIAKDYTCTFEYAGTMVGAFALEGRATNAVFTVQDDATFLAFGQDFFKTENGFTKALYKGKGVWDVVWKTEGKLGETNHFLNKDLPIVGITIQSNKIVVKGMRLGTVDIKEARRLKLKLDGTIKVSTDCDIVSHNALKEPRAWFGSPTLTWNVTLDNPIAPEAVFTSPNPPPVFARPAPTRPSGPKPDPRETELKNVLVNNPTNITAALALAEHFEKRRRPQDGHAVLDKLLVQTNISTDAVFELYYFYKERGDAIRCERALVRLSQILPDETWVWYTIAQVRAILGLTDSTLWALERAVSLSDKALAQQADAFDARTQARTNELFIKFKDNPQFQKLMDQ